MGCNDHLLCYARYQFQMYGIIFFFLFFIFESVCVFSATKFIFMKKLIVIVELCTSQISHRFFSPKKMKMILLQENWVIYCNLWVILEPILIKKALFVKKKISKNKANHVSEEAMKDIMKRPSTKEESKTSYQLISYVYICLVGHPSTRGAVNVYHSQSVAFVHLRSNFLLQSCTHSQIDKDGSNVNLNNTIDNSNIHLQNVALTTSSALEEFLSI
ncbi:hypothetical protein RFI_34070 [Reticulomyxa filosa]|uniref:Uncharacterized protein n=1 Tax=Reticulomyxa filosa TaxID=46433 RepID=X6LPP6_RETFI|nr:hypothetical protein RFI_34070 [Reticulomyxa filosa]|eukprot:ETO03341.1 hypothetical protein RFI_34070 [Reticulomyxa filosa]